MSLSLAVYGLCGQPFFLKKWKKVGRKAFWLNLHGFQDIDTQ
jgi:hypothetical protein